MVTLILVDYRTPKKTLNYINSFFVALSEEERESVDVLIIDNSENDCWKEFIRSQKFSFEKYEQVNSYDLYDIGFGKRTVKYLDTKRNLGYAKGNNLGAMISKKIWKDNRLLISNNDLEFPKQIILKEFETILADNPSVAIVGPSIITPSGKRQNPHKRNSIEKELMLRYFAYLFFPSLIENISDVDKYAKTGETYWVQGSFMYIDQNKFEEVGMFDENTFLYCEEKILSERLKKFGYSMYYLADQMLIHNHGSSVKNAFSSVKILEIGFKSAIYYYRTYLSVPAFKIFISKICFYIYKILYPLKYKIKEKIIHEKKK